MKASRNRFLQNPIRNAALSEPNWKSCDERFIPKPLYCMIFTLFDHLKISLMFDCYGAVTVPDEPSKHLIMLMMGWL